MTAADRTASPDGTGSGPLTIAQIAERAGVSVATVSKVVNGRADVSRATRSTVENVIRQHGYRRRKKAASPAALLELVFQTLSGVYANAVLQGVQTVARQHRLATVVSELRGQAPGYSWVEEVLARRPTGVISVFTGPTDEEGHQLRSRGIPFVIIDPTGEPGHESPSVGAGNWSGGLSATRHLLQLGHRRIGYLAGPAGRTTTRHRLEGHREALTAAGLAGDAERLTVQGAYDRAAGYDGALELLRREPGLTAIMAANDTVALGVCAALRDRGLRIPEDVSVTGFDDLPFAVDAMPALTTVRLPLHDAAARAGRLVLGRENPPPGGVTTFPTELMVRQSTAVPRR